MKIFHKYMSMYFLVFILAGNVLAMSQKEPNEVKDQETQTDERKEAVIFGVVRDHGVITVKQLTSAEALNVFSVELGLLKDTKNQTGAAQAIQAGKFILDGLFKSAHGLIVLGSLGGKFILKKGDSAWEWLKSKGF